MAHVKDVRSLAQELMGTRLAKLPRTYSEKLINNILQTLRKDQSARTNQFEVRNRLDGLIEKCRILNRDDLADALQSRLDEITTQSSKWTPEILSLLLSLSNRPIDRTHLEDLDRLIPEKPSPQPTLAEILADDSLGDQSVAWRDADVSANESDENDGMSLVSASLDERSESDEDRNDDASDSISELVIAIESEAINEVAKIQEIRSRSKDRASDNNDSWTELQLLREVIFMLLGLPTSLFGSGSKGEIQVTYDISTRSASGEAVKYLLNDLTRLGEHLKEIRNWVKVETRVSIEQTFQFALAKRLNSAESFLHATQAKFIDQSSAVLVSLLGLKQEVLKNCHLITQIALVCKDLRKGKLASRPFEILQKLFTLTCINQSTGDEEGYQYVAEIFLECFQTYLIPIRDWMERGEICEEKETMLVEKNPNPVPLQSVWHDQFRLVRNTDGAINAPSFLHMAAKKILNTGKCVHFLERLAYSDQATTDERLTETSMTFESICYAIDPYNLSPFPELFNAAFDQWISSKHRSWSAILKRYLETRYGLQNALDALEYIYFYRNAALSIEVIYPLFNKLDTTTSKEKLPWHDTLTTLELMHTSFSSLLCIDLNNLTLKPAAIPNTISTSTSKPIKPRSMAALATLNLHYTLPWPIANILRPSTLKTYASVFALLTQLHRSKHLLQTPKLPSSPPLLLRTHQQLLSFTNTILLHINTLVIPSLTTRMRSALLHQDPKGSSPTSSSASETDIDTMVHIHTTYIQQLSRLCMISDLNENENANSKPSTPKQIHTVLISILDLSVLWSDIYTTLTHSPSPPTTNNINHGPLLTLQTTYTQLHSIFAAGIDTLRKAGTSTSTSTSKPDSKGASSDSVDSEESEREAMLWTILAANLEGG